ncbi:MAG: GDP-L-fucose synthase, partial [Planctomycetota bacterium]
LAAASLHLLSLSDPPDWINLGTGKDISILELAQLVSEIVGFEGEIRTDPSKPDGTPVKRTNIELLESTGWQPSISLRTGLENTYAAFLNESDAGTIRC